MRIGGSWRGLSHASDQRELIHVLGSLFQQLCNMDPWDIGGNGFEWASMLGCGVWLRIPRIDVGHAALLEDHHHVLGCRLLSRGCRPGPTTERSQAGGSEPNKIPPRERARENRRKMRMMRVHERWAQG